MSTSLWDHETPVRDYMNVPRWIGNDINCSDVAAIAKGGCSSGAWMPAVEGHTAAQIMGEHGNEVFEWLEERGLLRTPSVEDAWMLEDASWTGLATYYLSTAVDLWALTAEGELLAAIDGAES